MHHSLPINSNPRECVKGIGGGWGCWGVGLGKGDTRGYDIEKQCMRSTIYTEAKTGQTGKRGKLPNAIRDKNARGNNGAGATIVMVLCMEVATSLSLHRQLLHQARTHCSPRYAFLQTDVTMSHVTPHCCIDHLQPSICQCYLWQLFSFVETRHSTWAMIH